jgi:hypothetical protein
MYQINKYPGTGYQIPQRVKRNVEGNVGGVGVVGGVARETSAWPPSLG